MHFLRLWKPAVKRSGVPRGTWGLSLLVSFSLWHQSSGLEAASLQFLPTESCWLSLSVASLNSIYSHKDTGVGTDTTPVILGHFLLSTPLTNTFAKALWPIEINYVGSNINAHASLVRRPSSAYYNHYDQNILLGWQTDQWSKEPWNRHKHKWELQFKECLEFNSLPKDALFDHYL